MELSRYARLTKKQMKSRPFLHCAEYARLTKQEKTRPVLYGVQYARLKPAARVVCQLRRGDGAGWAVVLLALAAVVLLVVVPH